MKQVKQQDALHHCSEALVAPLRLISEILSQAQLAIDGFIQQLSHRIHKLLSRTLRLRERMVRILDDKSTRTALPCDPPDEHSGQNDE